jgi:hypothetical protein
MIGVPDPAYGGRAAAFVVLRPGAGITLGDLMTH